MIKSLLVQNFFPQPFRKNRGASNFRSQTKFFRVTVQWSQDTLHLAHACLWARLFILPSVGKGESSYQSTIGHAGSGTRWWEIKKCRKKSGKARTFKILKSKFRVLSCYCFWTCLSIKVREKKFLSAPFSAHFLLFLPGQPNSICPNRFLVFRVCCLALSGWGKNFILSAAASSCWNLEGGRLSSLFASDWWSVVVVVGWWGNAGLRFPRTEQ